MAVAKVQSVTGNGATVVLNGCVAGNALIVLDSYFRGTSTGAAETTPTDSGGAFSVSRADAACLFSVNDIGVGIFHQQNIASGTHTVTPQANTDHHTTLTEYSGLATSGMFVAGSANSAKTADTNHTSQGTGATSTAAAAGDLAVIALCIAASPGAANVGMTDPVSGYTSLQVVQDDATTVVTNHAFQVLASGGTKSATFNWTDASADQSSQGTIATFVAATAAAFAPMMPTNIWGRNKMQLARPHVDASVSVLNNYVLAAVTGVYTYAGSAASTLATRLLAAATGVYTLTGAAALLAFGHNLLANTGVYTLTGSAASVLATRLLAATKGTFTLTGNAAATLWKHLLAAGTGVFTLTGIAANLARTYVLAATRGVFSLVGQAASVVYSGGVATAISEWVRRRRGRN